MIFIKLLRFALGMLAGPMVPGLLFGLNNLFSGSPVGITWFLMGAAIMGYPIGAIIGIPIYLAYFKKRPVTFWRCVFVGFFLGILSFMSVFIVGLISRDAGAIYAFKASIGFLPLSCFSGGLAAATFWLIARPDFYQNRKEYN